MEGVEARRVDVADPPALEALFAEIEAGKRGLDAIVNNAATQLVKPLLETEPDEWDALMAVNVRAALFTARYGYPLLRDRKGAIVNVASVHAVATSPGMSAYVTSKGALVALTRALALELAPDEVRVNCVLPGAVRTRMLEEGLSRGHLARADTELRLEELGRRHPLGRIGEPGEIAQAILFLADDTRSGFMTGQGLVVDGGATARLSTE
jgi:NAD(P)-dependent dehydrogenase (short-subunit alcohol dehydrogenase family)